MVFGLTENPAGLHFLLLLAALVLDAAVGDPDWLFRRVPHPVALVGRAIDELDRRLNRAYRSPRARLVRGALTTAALVLAAALLGFALTWLLRKLPFGWLLEIVVIAVLLAQRSLYDHVARVLKALDRGGLEAGRAAVAHIVGRDPKSLDAHGVARAAIESLAENFSDGVVAPAFWYAVFGLPGLFVYKTVNTLDSMIGHKTERHRHFGWAAARLDDVLNWIPARLSGLVIAAGASVIAGADPRAALAVMRRDANRHRSPNAGWPEAAMAGALGLALAGPRRYPHETVDDAWIGQGRRAAAGADVHRALLVFLAACIVHGLVVLAIYLAIHRVP